MEHVILMELTVTMSEMDGTPKQSADIALDRVTEALNKEGIQAYVEVVGDYDEGR